MNRIRGGATALGPGAVRWRPAAVARAQETTGRVVGRVIDKDTGRRSVA